MAGTSTKTTSTMKHTTPLRPLMAIACTAAAAITLRAQDPGSVIISEFMANPNDVSDAVGEWIELYNTTGVDVDITGWKLKDMGASTTIGNLTIPALSYLLFCRSSDPAENGGLTVDGTFSFTLNNSNEVITLTDADDVVINAVAYPNAVPGRSWQLDPAFYGAIPDIGNWCLGTGPYGTGTDQGTPRSANVSCGPAGLGGPASSPVLLRVVGDDLLVTMPTVASGAVRRWSVRDAQGRAVAGGALPAPGTLVVPIGTFAAGVYFFVPDGEAAARFVAGMGR
jgi:hypothetical protein